ncbi:MAG: rRNA pseudouridine synthase [FCB group bacterium]|nr:rRNA pseudouridine synthase [FCB group bacterium]
MGYCSRREAEKLIEQRVVKVNGVPAKITTAVNPNSDIVEIKNKKLEEKKKAVYIMLNKPAGVISTCNAGREKGRIVLNYVKIPERIYPVGRLDRDSTGLLLLTNDGELAYKLTHPSRSNEKEYLVEFDAPLTDRQVQLFLSGISLNGKKAKALQVNRQSRRKYSIILNQGLNRQIRRMAEAAGRSIVKLKRVRMGTLRLGRLSEGSWRYLTDNEINRLRQS